MTCVLAGEFSAYMLAESIKISETKYPIPIKLTHSRS